MLNEKSILITGGTGSFGRQFVRTVLKRFKPRRVVIYSRDELKQYEMQQELSPQKHPCMRYFIGDVRDRDRLSMAMREVDIVVHAAAIKHFSTVFGFKFVVVFLFYANCLTFVVSMPIIKCLNTSTRRRVITRNGYFYLCTIY